MRLAAVVLVDLNTAAGISYTLHASLTEHSWDSPNSSFLSEASFDENEGVSKSWITDNQLEHKHKEHLHFGELTLE